MLNSVSEKKLLGVKPELARVARRASEISSQPFQIVQGNRTQAEQNALYAQGRTKPGKIVTWTKNSKHIGGGAIDFAALVNGTINWDTKYYPEIARAFKKAASESGVGIAWGGDWKTKDWGHIELIASASPQAPDPVPAKPATKTTLKKGMTAGDVPTLQLLLKHLGDYAGLVDGDFGSKTEAAVKAFQARTGLKVDGTVGPLTWAKLAVAVPVGPTEPIPAPSAPVSAPVFAITLFESLGWSHLAAVALTASLMWESGGNSKGTIVTTAIGDAGKSHGAGQWNGLRYLGLLAFAADAKKSSSDLETQLLFVDYEMRTSEKRAGVALRAAQTIEAANDAAITYWRPSIPHADKRLAIAKGLINAGMGAVG